MKRMLFNATQAEELRVAMVDEQNLINFDIETAGSEQKKGNIYKGVITHVEPSLEACFVDYGSERHGFLPFKEIARQFLGKKQGLRIQEALQTGLEVLVQVDKDERGHKGAVLTTYISLAGRYIVLMPNNPRGGGVSRRAEGESRQALKSLIEQLPVPEGMSVIARTAGIGRSLEEMEWDLSYLLQLWSAIDKAAWSVDEKAKDKKATIKAPTLIFLESSLVIRAIRDYFQPDIGELLIDTKEVYEQAKQFMTHVMPTHKKRVKFYQESTPLFSKFQIEHQIETAFSRSVQLPSGGVIVIDHTEALVSIDVNSSRATKGLDIEETAFKTNVEAAEEIARQLRLRDLGGLIVIDFIDMENLENQRMVETALQKAIRQDRARIQLGRLSRFGLLEMSRQRLKPSLGETNYLTCPRCSGIGFIRGIESSALHILRTLQEEATKANAGVIRAQVPVDVATFLLNEKRSELNDLEDRLAVRVTLIPNVHMAVPDYKIEQIDLESIALEHRSYRMVEVVQEGVANTKKIPPKPLEALVKGVTTSYVPAHATLSIKKQIKRLLGYLRKPLQWVLGQKDKPVDCKVERRDSSTNSYKRQSNFRKNRQARWTDRRNQTHSHASSDSTKAIFGEHQVSDHVPEKNPTQASTSFLDSSSGALPTESLQKDLGTVQGSQSLPLSSEEREVSNTKPLSQKSRTHKRGSRKGSQPKTTQAIPVETLSSLPSQTVILPSPHQENIEKKEITEKVSSGADPSQGKEKVDASAGAVPKKRNAKRSPRTGKGAKGSAPNLGGLIMVSTTKTADAIQTPVVAEKNAKRRRDQQKTDKTETKVADKKLEQIQTKS